MRRPTNLIAVAMLGMLLLGAKGSPNAVGDRQQRRLPPSDETARAERLREGTKLVGQVGYFKMSGDRATFFAKDGERRFVGLENLNLARIVNTIADAPTAKIEWTVDGTITEYRGANYLLVTRAVRRIGGIGSGSNLLRRDPQGSGASPRPTSSPRIDGSSSRGASSYRSDTQDEQPRS